MVVCKFFLQGSCRFGDKCRNEHPSNSNSNNPSRFGTQNRFGALANSGGGGNDSRSQASTYSPSTPDDIRLDLTEGKGRPNWILSAYGPGKNPPASLLEPNEYSPEEIRARFYELASQGKQDEADSEAITLWNKAQQAMNDVRNDADRVKGFMDDASKNDYNRYSLYKMDGTRTREQLFGSQSNAPTFSAQNNTTTFSSLPNNPFSTAPSSTGFGNAQTVANPFSKPAASTFGQPSSSPSPFGGTATRTTSTFGQSGFGSQSSGNAFGQPATSSTFGQSGFGSQSNASGFGQPASSGAFGQPNSNTQPSGTGFGQPAGSSTFGQGSFGKPTQGSFGQPVFGSSGFGSQAQSNAFASPEPSSGSGQTQTQSSSGFGAPSQPSAFGKPAFGQPAASSTHQQPAFGPPAVSSAFGQPAVTSTSQQSGFGTKFGQPTQSGQQSPFGSNTGTFGSGKFGSAAPAPAFGSSSTIGGFGGKTNDAPSNPFGVKPTTPISNEADMDTAASRPASSDNPFSKPPNAPSAFAPASSSTQPTGPAAAPNNKVPLTYTQTLPKVAPTFDGSSKKLLTFRGQRVVWVEDVVKVVLDNATPTYSPCYRRPDGKGPEKIWFPAGNADAVAQAISKYKIGFEAPESEYTEEVEESYRMLHETGQWKDGKMPSVAPRRAWVDCDF